MFKWGVGGLRGNALSSDCQAEELLSLQSGGSSEREAMAQMQCKHVVSSTRCHQNPSTGSGEVSGWGETGMENVPSYLPFGQIQNDQQAG